MITTVDLWIEGKEVKGLVYNGQFFRVSLFPKKEAIEAAESVGHIKGREETKASGQKDRGERVCTQGHISIYKNIAEEISTETSFSGMAGVIKSYYPYYKDSSCKAAVIGYKRFLKEFNNNLGNSKALKTYQLQGIVKKKHRTPKDAIYYDNVYRVWIKNGMVQKVRQAIFKVEFGYKPTLSNIVKESKMAHHSVRAVLKYLKEKGEIEFSTKKGIYEPM